MATHPSILAWEILWAEKAQGDSPWGHKDLDTTELLSTHTHTCPVKPPLVYLPGRTHLLICDHFKFSMNLSVTRAGLSRGRSLRTHRPSQFSQGDGESPRCGQIAVDCKAGEGMEVDPQISPQGGAPKPVGPNTSQSRGSLSPPNQLLPFLGLLPAGAHQLERGAFPTK